MIIDLNKCMLLISIILCILWAYRTGKLNGFNLGIEYLVKKGISKSIEGNEHFCNVTTCNVVCFEKEGELWVKEYSGRTEKEGRTYLVFYCPWCGYQTGKSKMHEMLEDKMLCEKSVQQ